MISVEEAISILDNNVVAFGDELVSLVESVGRILREDVIADLDMPPFDRVSMDGIAIDYESFANGERTFTIQEMAAAGYPQKTLLSNNDCIEIMTGSILPVGADTIIPYEWLTIENEIVLLTKENVIQGQNIHRKGTDRKKGDLLIPSGRLISASEVGVLAAVGKSKVKVSRLPKVIIISTGDELMEVDVEPLPHQVRMSNVHQLQAALQNLKIESERMHLKDDFEFVRNSLEICTQKYDVIIVSGGVSKGKFDFIPKALEAVGVNSDFDEISQRPGKPFWFGTHPSGCTVFAIPGNPVSSFLCYIRYIKPWLEACLQKESSPQPVAKLSEEVVFKPDLTYFLTVRLKQNNNGEMIANPLKGQGSGDLANLVDADAFLELPKGKDVFMKGEAFAVYKF